MLVCTQPFCALEGRLTQCKVQVLNRVLIVDTLHTSQQPNGNAWAARMSIIGGITGFFV